MGELVHMENIIFSSIVLFIPYIYYILMHIFIWFLQKIWINGRIYIYNIYFMYFMYLNFVIEAVYWIVLCQLNMS